MKLMRARAQLIGNERFWSDPAIVRGQEVPRPFLHWYERVLLEDASARLVERFGEVRLIHVVGCGPGREVPMVRSAFSDARIVASDISRAMTEACARNLARWSATDQVEVRCAEARTLRHDGRRAELVVMLNSVLTYVTPRADRGDTLATLHGLLAPGGLLVGTVQHRWGAPAKSAYFALRRVLHALGIVRREAGERTVRLDGLRRRLYYFTPAEIRQALRVAGFQPMLVQPLRRLAGARGMPYRWRGDNNLVFTGEA